MHNYGDSLGKSGLAGFDEDILYVVIVNVAIDHQVYLRQLATVSLSNRLRDDSFHAFQILCSHL